MVTFYSSLELTPQHSRIWKVAEDYTWIGQTRYQVIDIRDEEMFLRESSVSPHWVRAIAKVVSWVLIFPFLLAWGVRTYYRRPYQARMTFPFLPNEKVIEQLQAHWKNGQKLALFVGRDASESLPQEEGWIWCSLDLSDIPPLIFSDRLHLKYDFNSKIAQIEKLFNRVVVDRNVLNFFESDKEPWKMLKCYLAQQSDSELITEKHRQSHIFVPERELIEGSRGIAVWPKSKAENWKTEGEPKLIHAIQEHLEREFERVELVVGKPYPYLGDSMISDYWKLTLGKKSLANK